MMRVIIERDRCVASGQCVMLAPTVFDQDDDGIVVLVKDQPDEGEKAGVGDSIRVCPSLAISSAG
jgi:ferredoxin